MLQVILCLYLTSLPLQPLEAELKKALKGDLEEVVLALLKTPVQYDAQQLKLAMKVGLSYGYYSRFSVFS